MASHPESKRILVIDVGGSNIKLIATGIEKRLKIPSDPDLTAAQLVEQVLDVTSHWKYDVISLGCPCACRNNRPVRNPHNLGKGWKDFDFEAAFQLPTKVINDATMQAIGCYEGGTMLFLGFGTGLGTTLIKDGTAIPLEGGHLPYRKKQSFEDYVGKTGFARLGVEKWNTHVQRVIKTLRLAFNADDVVLGGGNAKLIEHLPPHTRRVNNHAALTGGFRMWDHQW
ncbi:ROK family protein [Rubritalea tangerina]|uniref:ROK family protein n=1 Tax=Rubritalea tangerina TaxID=430798 RepID=A0ABW4Z9L4_9BACT